VSRGDGTGRVRAVYAHTAPHGDRLIGSVERLLVGNGHAWAARQARGVVERSRGSIMLRLVVTQPAPR
jgi:hypothetical protein